MQNYIQCFHNTFLREVNSQSHFKHFLIRTSSSEAVLFVTVECSQKKGMAPQGVLGCAAAGCCQARQSGTPPQEGRQNRHWALLPLPHCILLLLGSGAQLETAVFHFSFEKINVYIMQVTCLASELPEHEGAHRTRLEGTACLGLPSVLVHPLSGLRLPCILTTPP